MVQINGTYLQLRNENFVEYLKHWGIPEDAAKKADTRHPTYEINVEGKKVTVTTDSGDEEPSSKLVYVLGEEVDEKLPIVLLKSTAELDEDKLTIFSKALDGKTFTRVYQFSDNGFVQTLTVNPGGLTAKRHFKRI